MKTQISFTRKLGYVTILMMVAFAFSPMYGQSTAQQEKTIKGIVSNVHGPLEGVNIILKGANEGTVSNKKGEYTFPVALKPGDVLLFSYLGYRSVEFKIKPETSFIKTVMSDEVIEFMGDLNTDKRYKSKRKN